ncbi:pilus assembly protein TadG-related protein [Candidatus Solincola sp.]|nr:pilus assembly protein TadG-related protein [Actinomycetota bacterium]
MRGEAAGVTVIAAALVPVMLLLALILHDVTQVYAARSQAQTAADAAAKAAGLELTPLFGVGNDPTGAARDYARRNGCELVSCETGGNERYLWVTVRVARRADRLFLKPGGAVLTATARCYLDLSDDVNR